MSEDQPVLQTSKDQERAEQEAQARLSARVRFNERVANAQGGIDETDPTRPKLIHKGIVMPEVSKEAHELAVVQLAVEKAKPTSYASTIARRILERPSPDLSPSGPIEDEPVFDAGDTTGELGAWEKQTLPEEDS